MAGIDKQKPGKLDLYAEATNRIIAAIEKSEIENKPLPWRMPWNTVDLGPLRNGSSDHTYQGINAILLGITAKERNLSDPRWMTYRQAKFQGLQVKQGAKSEKIYFYKNIEIEAKDMATGQSLIDPETGQAERMSIPFLQLSHVFNAADIDGIEPLVSFEQEFSPLEAGERIKAACPVRIRHAIGNRAFYSTSSDSVTLPPPEQFKTPEGYYSVLAHETVHATGHPTRLQRDHGGRYGSGDYAFEELVAEIGSVQIGARTGLPVQIEGHASYVQNWLVVLKHDKKAIFKASAEASRAVEFLLNPEKRQAMTEEAKAKASRMAVPRPRLIPSLAVTSPASAPRSFKKPFPPVSPQTLPNRSSGMTGPR